MKSRATPRTAMSAHNTLRDVIRSPWNIAAMGKSRIGLSEHSVWATPNAALTDGSLVSGIGNAYSDEILFAARLSPLRLTHAMTAEQVGDVHAAIVRTLNHWIRRIDEVTPGALPAHQPTWRREFAVHGRFNEPCPRCDTPVARISFAESETNYCPTCQTGGRVLADRRMSRFFRR